MELAGKLQLKDGMRVAVVGPPDGVDLALPEGMSTAGETAGAEAVIAFARTTEDLDGSAVAALEAARADRLAWIAYPKAGRLGTDLNRDRLAASVRERGAQPVRQVSIDEVWSALRLRPL